MLRPTSAINLSLAGLALLFVAVLLSSSASATGDDETDVAVTALVITSESEYGEERYAPDYHDLYVTPPETVTFRNLASFEDARDDGLQRKLVISIASDSNEEEWFTTTYTAPYTWSGRPEIQQSITAAGPNPEIYRVDTIYRVYRWSAAQEWEVESSHSLGENAYVYKMPA